MEEEDHPLEPKKSTPRTCSTCSSAAEGEEASGGTRRVSRDRHFSSSSSCPPLTRRLGPHICRYVRSAFHFGNSNFRTARAAQPRRAAPADDGPPPPLYVQLLPLLILFAFSLVTILPSLFSTAPPPPPTYSFSPHPPTHTTLRQTATYSIPYYVDQAKFEQHALWESIPEGRRGEQRAGKWSNDLRKWEREVEVTYVRGLEGGCRREMEDRERRVEEKRGFFGIGADWDEVRR